MTTVVKFIVSWVIPVVISIYFISLIINISKDTAWVRNIMQQLPPKIISFWVWLDNINKFLPPAVLTLCVAWAVYMKAISLLEINSLHQISDRCLATRLKEDVLENGVRLVHPDLINDGGDAIAYEQLVKNYKDSSGDLKREIRKYLTRINGNLDSAEATFPKMQVQRPPESKWYPKSIDENYPDFNIKNVIEQTQHGTYWMTRAESVRLLRNKNYILNYNKLPQSNRDILNSLKDWEAVLFGNIIKRVAIDNSLIVRKMALDTYKQLVCDEDSKECKFQCKGFIEEDIYYFDRAVQHWEKNKIEILESFRKKIAIIEP
jgi:hypothetical protein